MSPLISSRREPKCPNPKNLNCRALPNGIGSRNPLSSAPWNSMIQSSLGSWGIEVSRDSFYGGLKRAYWIGPIGIGERCQMM